MKKPPPLSQANVLHPSGHQPPSGHNRQQPHQLCRSSASTPDNTGWLHKPCGLLIRCMIQAGMVALDQFKTWYVGDRKYWVRPEKMFFETIERDGKYFSRFTEIDWEE